MWPTASYSLESGGLAALWCTHSIGDLAGGLGRVEAMKLDFENAFTERTPRIVNAAKLHRAASRRKAERFLIAVSYTHLTLPTKLL